ncbi:MAG: tryptophan--tRNA ligase, partial [Oscillospiraceae bacterium]
AGLFTYPVLMAADILLYQTDFVPVGADQKQHLELARDIATRFNALHGKTFIVPEPFIQKTNARVMSLADPTKKMSKSDENTKSFISIIDSPELILKKINAAVTDSDAKVFYGEGKDGINNLLSIYCAITNQTIEVVERTFAGKGYGDFKRHVGEAIVEELRPVRERYNTLMQDTDYLLQSRQQGALKATQLAQKTLDKVYKKIGI